MATDMVFGCSLPASELGGTNPAMLRELARLAEELGFASVWINDHLVIPETIASPYPYNREGKLGVGPTSPFMEPLTTLAHLAGCTERLRLGISVYVLPYRNPIVTAKVAATLDNLSGGRLEFGIGAGWMKEEFEALGYDYYHQRGAVTDEQLKVITALWTQDVASFEGTFYRFSRIGAHPRPVQKPHPPIWVGGNNIAGIRRAARFGQGWLPVGNISFAELTEGIATLRAETARAGRDPAAVQVGIGAGVSFGVTGQSEGGERRPFRGTPAEIAADVRRHRDAGVSLLVFGFGRAAQMPEAMRRFATEVRPLVD